MRVAYLGPPGTFSEEALGLCDLARGAEAAPMPSIADAYDAVFRGEAEMALLPIENSLEGSVGTTLDLLVHHPGPLIRREVLLPVREPESRRHDADNGVALPIERDGAAKYRRIGVEAPHP